MTTDQLGFFLCLASIAACDLSPKDGGEIMNDEDTGSTGSESAEGQMTPEVDDADEADEDDADDSTTGGADGPDDAGTGEDAPTDVELCQAGCAYETACDAGYPLDACMSDCLYNLGVFDAVPECDEAWHTVVACLGELQSCNPTMLPAGCGMAAETAAMCEDEYSCSIAGGGPVGGPECEVAEQCGSAPPRSIACDGEVCTCSVDGEVTGECPARGICEAVEDLGGLADAALECCGFEGFGEPKIPGE